MKIVQKKLYNGVEKKINRLGLSDLFKEIEDIIKKPDISIKKEKNSNGGAFVKEKLYEQFRSYPGWKEGSAGVIDWIKEIQFSDSQKIRVGVEVQVSARSDLVIRDFVHLGRDFRTGEIDIGVIILPSDDFAYYLTDRAPSLKEAIGYIEVDFRTLMDYPIIIYAIENDGWSETPLPKKKTRH